MEIPVEVKLRFYSSMLRIRKFELKAAELFGQGQVPGSIHSCAGQEACAEGVCARLRTDDYLIGAHRGHGQCLAKGAESRYLLAELLGKKSGYCLGKGGSMHVAVPEIGILGTNGIVGGGIPSALGVAVAVQYRGTDQVVTCFFGEGASNQGTFHETLNIASLWSLPIIFICENNLYAELTPHRLHLKLPDVARRAEAYGIPSTVVDGNDVLAVYEAAGVAVERARSGGGPTFIEGKTYRWEGHFVGDPAKYRPAGELEEWKGRDPILRLKAHLLENGLADGDQLAGIEMSIEEEIKEAVEFAVSSNPPDPSTDLMSGVYAAFDGF